MKMFIVFLLHFTGWLGWLALFILSVNDIIPDKWYVVFPLFILATIWFFFMNGVTQRYRERK
jgi:hypothetical protein